jgi:hypothetical protein
MAVAIGETKQISGSDKVVISPTPVVLAYFAEKRKGTRKSVTRAVFDVAKKMDGTNLYMDAVFRGFLRSTKGSIKSETVDNELWYWFSNNFLRECSFGIENDDYCFEITPDKTVIEEMFSEYKIDNLSKNLTEITWGDDSNRLQFISILSEVISSAE